ncbi:MAG: exopolysaccharide production repressor protein [Aquamicrobium sp.]|uniref:exopolysaccharide production repressor protein n=1 Tax=Mesorhizobium sp. Pch-S TaxID=2082387 RepID=UPI001011132C|nr:exopolysaccharide production repressor protein [Mesorhizobium sp. Pch-S]MBR2689786.1 exopolysaccharide production repressor protein [Aquamicrobium sp.]QAZ43731.1 exopolysaccharide production repressor protein exox [Mesorhizobium sp. Pch-S]
MSFLLFLRGFIAVLVAFAVASYAITQSAWTTFIQTLICAVIIQVGYFIAILFMVWRSGETGKRGETLARGENAAASATDIQPKGETAQMPGVGRSPLP